MKFIVMTLLVFCVLCCDAIKKMENYGFYDLKSNLEGEIICQKIVNDSCFCCYGGGKNDRYYCHAGHYASHFTMKCTEAKIMKFYIIDIE